MRLDCCSSASRASSFLDLSFELGETAVLELGRARVVAAALRLFDLVADLLEVLLQLARSLNGVLLLLPVERQLVLLLLEIGELLFELLQPILRRLVLLLAQRLALDLELHDAALDLVELRGHRVDLGAQARGRFVDQVDGLVGQEPIGDVAV